MCPRNPPTGARSRRRMTRCSAPSLHQPPLVALTHPTQTAASNQRLPEGSLFHVQHKPVTRCRLIQTSHSCPAILRNGGGPARCHGSSSNPTRRRMQHPVTPPARTGSTIGWCLGQHQARRTFRVIGSLDWQKLTEEIKDALRAGGSRIPAIISAALPKYDDETTYGVLITNEGDVVPLRSADPSSFYNNYIPAGHVEGKAAIWIREHGSTGGVLYHNNTGGTCGYCNSQIERLLPKDAELLVIPPADAIAKKRGATQDPTPYKGDNIMPQPPRQYDLFRNQP
jgi:hypothetical protein